MNKNLILERVQSPTDWAIYHQIREAELWTARGRKTPAYDSNHPDDFNTANTPLLLKQAGFGIGTTRLDNLGNGRFCVRLVAIERTHQGQGLGRWMLQQTIALVRAHHGKEVVVNADSNAVGYYGACGFKANLWDANELRSPLAQGCVQMAYYL